MSLIDLFIFAGFPADKKTVLQKIIRKRNLKRSEYFVKEGSICSEIAFIDKGMVKHFYNTESGEVTRWVSIKGDILSSFTSLIKGEPGNENIVSISPVVLSVLNIKDLKLLAEEYPQVQKIWTHFIELYCIGLEERLYHLIAFDARQNYEFLLKNYPDLIKNVPAKYIASILGIEPRHLSRLKAAK
jgi:CRP/FNR family transcriptional regulator, anaerobic regulatory protein